MIFSRQRGDDLDDELQSHLRMAAQDRVDRGLAPEEAQAAARREFGNVGLVHEVTRDAEGWNGLRRFMRDLEHGLRVLRRNPGFAAVSIFTLALGIGASTAIFSVVYGVLLRPLPYDKPDQIVRVWSLDGKGNRFSFSDANFQDVRAQNQALQAVAEYRFGVNAVSGGAEPERVPVAYVSHDFFDVFAVHPVLGRPFIAQEEKPNGPAAAVVSESFWRNYLGARSDLSSLKFIVANQAVAVVGVMPSGFHYPGDTQIWLSSDTSDKPTSRSAGGWQVVGRVREGVSVQRATAELNGLGQRIRQLFSRDTAIAGAVAVPLRDAMTENTRPALLILLAVSGLLLLVACANVTNLLLAQASAREAELAVRSALGASRGRLVRQFLAESLLLGMTGAALGIVVAYVGVRGLLVLAPQNLPRLNEVSVNFPVLFFALVVSLIVAAGLGIFTALRAGSAGMQAAIARAEKGQVSGSRNSSRLGQIIVAGQIAVTLVLLIGAGLLGRSFLRVLSVDPGFRTERVLTLDLAVSAGDDSGGRGQQLQRILEALRGIPGVIEVGGTSDLPLESSYGADGTFALINPEQLSPATQDLIQRFVRTKGQLAPADYKALDEFFTPLFADKQHTGQANYVVASEGYFRALGILLLRGRLFNAADTMEAPHSALISESLAQQTWPNSDPLGRTIEFGNMDGDLRLLTVVGVVGDIRGTSLETPPKPTIYVSYLQRPQKTDQFSVVMRTNGDPGSMLFAARKTINRIAPRVPVRTNTFTQVFSASLDTRRFNLLLVGIFAVTALLLAIAGIYGVLAYSVARRTRELGVRIALGATSLNVLNLVLRQALVTALVGVLIGGVAALALTRLMQSLLFGVSSTDPITYAGVAAMLLLVAGLAAYIPARRATRVDPMVALRYE